jgi:two-component system, NtrC family, response regulator AtoC
MSLTKLRLVEGPAEPTLTLGDRALVVADPAMLGVYDLLRRLARSELPVLLQGETGAGKEMAAWALHAWSPRAGGPFVPVNCAALPETLVESELFGCRRGAFSGADRDRIGLFESASGGTLFLDEVGELSPAAQAKLLRALDGKEITRLGAVTATPVDTRVVAATNRDLAALVAASRFREDLYFRLNAAQVALPALRQRPLDIPVLAATLLARACARAGRRPMRISDHALQMLEAHDFPGNVRELANAMEYAAAIADGEVLEPHHLPPRVSRRTEPAVLETGGPTRGRRIADELAELEKRRMQEALAGCGGNQSRAAELIGMPRRTFVTKLARYGLGRT